MDTRPFPLDVGLVPPHNRNERERLVRNVMKSGVHVLFCTPRGRMGVFFFLPGGSGVAGSNVD